MIFAIVIAASSLSSPKVVALQPDVRQVSDLPLLSSPKIAALPPDVRQVSDLPSLAGLYWGLRPMRAKISIYV